MTRDSPFRIDSSAALYQSLQISYDWFTEGFDGIDLRAAKALLSELSLS